MHSSLWSRIAAACLMSFMLINTCALAQQIEPTQTRPRRIQTPSQTDNTIPPARTGTTHLTEEPILRIGLATAARSATISTTGHLLNLSGSEAAPVPLSTARVRLEPRLLSPSRPAPENELCRVEIPGAATRPEAEHTAKEVQELTAKDCEIAFESANNTWNILVGPAAARIEAEELRARLEEAGYSSAAIVQAHASESSNSTTTRSSTTRLPSSNNRTAASASSGANSSATGRASISSSNNKAVRPISESVRPVSRLSLPGRELVAYAAGHALLFSSSAPVVFASDDEKQAPVRFNEKPYRGRLEVFTNPGGTLTVVNVVGLEDYVRGVVPNELSPGSYGALEALKAQAVAARTYAVKNRGQFMAKGFDLLPTTRSQVYGGMSSEHPLSSRAVEETQGIIATYQGEPINALYTSTCGGRTEDAENIFNEALPYLRGHECAPEGRAALLPFTIRTSRELADIQEEQNVPLARDAALLMVHDFKLTTARLTDSWLAAPASLAEVRNWLASASRLAHQPAPSLTDEATRLPGFATSLAAAVYGESRADTLLDNADIEYLLSFRDANEISERNRADVAMLLRDGVLSLYPDATLRPREQMPRARVLRAITRLLEMRGALQLQKAITRPTSTGSLVVRSSKGQDQPIILRPDAFLFRTFGDGVARQTRTLVLVGGEPATFHVNGRGEVDYLEARPAPNGAASDRFSPFSNWTSELSLAQAQARLSRQASGIGPLQDLRVTARGSSRRVIDLEIIGANGTSHLRGGHIRSVLGLREQLFVIDRRYDENGRVTGFLFTGRGWGHGVGMCQVGAYGLARSGWSYDRILKAYYTGIELTKLY